MIVFVNKQETRRQSNSLKISKNSFYIQAHYINIYLFIDIR